MSMMQMLFAGGNLLAYGGTVTTSGNYRIHTFNSSGTLTVTSAPPNSTVEYLVVAGGGSGGGNFSSGGGGAGGDALALAVLCCSIVESRRCDASSIAPAFRSCSRWISDRRRASRSSSSFASSSRHCNSFSASRRRDSSSGDASEAAAPICSRVIACAASTECEIVEGPAA